MSIFRRAEFFVFLFLVVSSASGAQVYVDNTMPSSGVGTAGSPYKTLSDALTDSSITSQGGTIYLVPTQNLTDLQSLQNISSGLEITPYGSGRSSILLSYAATLNLASQVNFTAIDFQISGSSSAATLFAIGSNGQVSFTSCTFTTLSNSITSSYLMNTAPNSSLYFDTVTFQGFSSASFTVFLKIQQFGALTMCNVTFNLFQVAQGSLIVLAEDSSATLQAVNFTDLAFSSSTEILSFDGNITMSAILFQNISTQTVLLKITNTDITTSSQCSLTCMTFSNLTMSDSNDSLIMFEPANMQINLTSLNFISVNSSAAVLNILGNTQGISVANISFTNVLGIPSLLISQSKSAAIINFTCHENNIYGLNPSQQSFYGSGGACLRIDNVLSSILNNLNFSNSQSLVEAPGLIITSDDSILAALQTNLSFAASPSCLISNSSFSNLTADLTQDTQGGAAMFINSSMFVSIVNTTFNANQLSAATYFGGPCVRSTNINSRITIMNSTMALNSAEYGSNCLEIIGSVLNITSTDFDSNNPINLANLSETYNRGGALLLSVDYADIYNSSFSNNSNYAGGALYFSSSFGSQTNPSITILDCNFTNNSATIAGVLSFCDGCLSLNTQIVDSNFLNNSASLGGVISISYAFDACVIDVYGGLFEGNTAINSGGVAYCIHTLGFLNFIDSTFRSNQANQGGVIYGVNSFSATIENENCIFEYNQAYKAAVFYIYEMNLTSINVTLRHNHGNTSGSVFYQKGYGDFRNAYFYNETAGETAILDLDGSGFSDTYNLTFESCRCVSTVSCAIIYGYDYVWFPYTYTYNFTNNYIGQGALFMLQKASGSRADYFNVTLNDSYYSGNYGNGYIISADRAKILMNNFTLVNNSLPIFTASYGTIWIDNVDIYYHDCSSSRETCFMYGESDTIVTILDLNINQMYDTSTLGTIYLLNSQITVYQMTIQAINGVSPLFNLKSSTLYFTNSQVSNISVPILNAQSSDIEIDTMAFDNSDSSTTASSLMACSECLNFTLTDSSFSHQQVSSQADGGALYLSNVAYSNPQAFLLQNLTVQNFAGAMNGAAVYIQHTNVLINASSFSNNQGTNGGALYLAYQEEGTWSAVGNPEIENSRFTQNSAYKSGGAIATDCTTFDFITDSSNVFQENAAYYGPTFALAPSSLNMELVSTINNSVICDINFQKGSCSIPDIPSGQTLPYDLIFILVDALGQEVLTENQSSSGISLLIESLNNTADMFLLDGQTSSQCSGGIFNYSDVTITGTPKTSATLVFTTDALDPSLSPSRRRNLDSASQTAFTYQIKMYFRDCEVGEIYESELNTCQICPSGYYSVNTSDTGCTQCPDNAECQGGNDIEVNAGYWRSSITSIEIHECTTSPENCLGGFYSNCSTGYTGPLCEGCDTTGDVKYFNLGSSCVQCGSKVASIVKLVFIFIFGVLFMAFLIQKSVIVPLKTGKRKLDFNSVAGKIVLNYVQVISIVQKLDLKWPGYVQTSFNTQSILGSLNEQMVSIDCFFTDSPNDDTNSLYFSGYFTKLFLIGIGPFIGVLILAFYWSIVYFRKKQLILEYTVACSIIVAFIFQPTVVNAMLANLNCEEIDTGETYVRSNLLVQCWTKPHKLWSYSLVFPSLGIWVLAFPLYLFLKLRKNRAILEIDFHMQGKYGFIYKSYTSQYYYWELVVFARKVAILILPVFISSDVLLQAMGAIVILIFAFFLQTRAKPFRTTELNNLEMWALLVSQITIAGGLFFLEISSSVAQIIIFIIMLIANSIFIIKLLHLLYKANKDAVKELIAKLKLLRKLGWKGYKKYLKEQKETVKVEIKQFDRSEKGREEEGSRYSRNIDLQHESESNANTPKLIKFDSEFDLRKALASDLIIDDSFKEEEDMSENSISGSNISLPNKFIKHSQTSLSRFALESKKN